MKIVVGMRFVRKLVKSGLVAYEKRDVLQMGLREIYKPGDIKDGIEWVDVPYEGEVE